MRAFLRNRKQNPTTHRKRKHMCLADTPTDSKSSCRTFVYMLLAMPWEKKKNSSKSRNSLSSFQMRHCCARMFAYALCLWVCAYVCRVCSEPQSAVEQQKTLAAARKNNDDSCHQGTKDANANNRSKTNTQASFLVLVELSNLNGASPMVLFESSAVS